MEIVSDEIAALYKSLISKVTKAGASDLKGDQTAERLAGVVVAARGFLSTLDRADLISKISGKSYYVFSDEKRGKTSRPVNRDLYDDMLDLETIQKVLACKFEGMTPSAITRIVYTCAISYCCAADILKKSDQKTPGTFFETLIGHIVARALGVNPEKQISVPTLDLNISIPTDYIFDLGAGKNRIHLPCKISTRERVVQVWAHQRVLDGMHGVARFKGILVAMAETNKQEEISVAEVCLPNQWRAYQMYIAQIFRVYYLDIPQPYIALKHHYPFLQVKQFGEMFFELDKIEASGAG